MPGGRGRGPSGLGRGLPEGDLDAGFGLRGRGGGVVRAWVDVLDVPCTPVQIGEVHSQRARGGVALGYKDQGLKPASFDLKRYAVFPDVYAERVPGMA